MNLEHLQNVYNQCGIVSYTLICIFLGIIYSCIYDFILRCANYLEERARKIYYDNKIKKEWIKRQRIIERKKENDRI